MSLICEQIKKKSYKTEFLWYWIIKNGIMNELKTIFFLFQKEWGAENYGDRGHFSSKILPILEKKASPSMQFHKCGSPRCKLEQQMDKQMDGQSQYTCKKKSRLVQFDEKKTS